MVSSVLHPNNRLRNVTVRVVHKFPFGLIVGAIFFRDHESIFGFGLGKGFKSKPSSSWIPFTDESVGRPALALVVHFCILTALTPDDGPKGSTPHRSFPSCHRRQSGLSSRKTTAPLSAGSASWKTVFRGSLATAGSNAMSSS